MHIVFTLPHRLGPLFLQKQKPLPLPVDEFLTRFLLHVLPQGFVQVSPLPKSNFVLHRWSRSRHETTFSNSKLSRVSKRTGLLRLAAEQTSSCGLYNHAFRGTFSQ
jgi:hypothetical protein